MQNVSKEKGYEPTTYSLNLLPLSNKLTRGSQKNGQGLVQKLDIQETVLQETVNNTVNGVVKGKKVGKVIHKLQTLYQPTEKTDYVTDYIVEELGDVKSRSFYHLVASKIPEPIIRQTLSEIRTDGARHPAKLFTYKINQYAIDRVKYEFSQTKKNLLRGIMMDRVGKR